jgi:hypothetical protein
MPVQATDRGLAPHLSQGIVIAEISVCWDDPRAIDDQPSRAQDRPRRPANQSAGRPVFPEPLNGDGSSRARRECLREGSARALGSRRSPCREPRGYGLIWSRRGTRKMSPGHAMRAVGLIPVRGSGCPSRAGGLPG